MNFGHGSGVKKSVQRGNQKGSGARASMMEHLEERRLMSSGPVIGAAMNSPISSEVVEINARDVKPFLAAHASSHHARADAEAGLFAAELPGLAGDPLASGTYSPRVKLWGAVRDSVHDSEVHIADSQQVGGLPGTSSGRGRNRPDNAPRALVIEDDTVTRDTLISLLRKRGWNVTGVGTVAEGHAQLANEPHVVILDLTLPDGKGETLLREIRRDHPLTRVAVTTGSDDPTRLRQVESLEPDMTLNKPIALPMLFELLPVVRPAASAISPAGAFSSVPIGGAEALGVLPV